MGKKDNFECIESYGGVRTKIHAILNKQTGNKGQCPTKGKYLGITLSSMTEFSIQLKLLRIQHSVGLKNTLAERQNRNVANKTTTTKIF